MYYLNYFFMYSLIGYLLETGLYLILDKSGNSGYLMGPWTPVYGIGIVLIILMYNFIDKHIKKNKFIKLLVLFFVSAIILSIIEWCGGILIEKVFHYTCWNYSNLKFHIGKYVALELAVVWGLLAIFFILFLKRISDYIIKRIPKYITYTLVILFIIDNILTIVKRLK